MWPSIQEKGFKWTTPDSQSLLLTSREYSVTVNLMWTLTMSPMIKIKYVELAFTLVTRATSKLWAMWDGCYFYLHWTYWTAFVHASCILSANWWAQVWLLVTGPFILGIDPDGSLSLGGVSYSEFSDPACISAPPWVGVICISKFQWTT